MEKTCSYIEKGKLFEEEEKYELAEAEYLKAVELNPNSYTAYCHLGDIC
ncbi:MAG: tetratricopeptide repeat protein, partial [Vampirovibrionia bacterium]